MNVDPKETTLTLPYLLYPPLPSKQLTNLKPVAETKLPCKIIAIMTFWSILK